MVDYWPRVTTVHSWVLSMAWGAHVLLINKYTPNGSRNCGQSAINIVILVAPYFPSKIQPNIRYRPQNRRPPWLRKWVPNSLNNSFSPAGRAVDVGEYAVSLALKFSRASLTWSKGLFSLPSSRMRLNHGSSALKSSSLHLNCVRRLYRFETSTTYLARSLGAGFVPFNSEMVVPVNLQHSNDTCSKADRIHACRGWLWIFNKYLKGKCKQDAMPL